MHCLSRVCFSLHFQDSGLSSGTLVVNNAVRPASVGQWVRGLHDERKVARASRLFSHAWSLEEQTILKSVRNHEMFLQHGLSLETRPERQRIDDPRMMCIRDGHPKPSPASEKAAMTAGGRTSAGIVQSRCSYCKLEAKMRHLVRKRGKYRYSSGRITS